MEDFLLYDYDLKCGIEALLVMNDYNAIIQDIAKNLIGNGFDSKCLKDVLNKHNVEKINNIKDNTLGFVVDYIKLILDDFTITENERKIIGFLKLYFKIKA